MICKERIYTMKRRVCNLLLALVFVLALLCPAVQTAQAAGRPAGNGRPYYIMVNRAMNTVTVYGLDANGYYTVPVKAMVCSVGRSGSVTPRGNFSVAAKRRWCRMVDGSYGQYATQFYGNYLFHSICYSAANPATMLTYEYNMLGGPASLGCVRLQTADAKWIYDNCAAGTKVTVYDDAASPGPLGKPDKRLSQIPAAMDNGWDPTDPLEDNPWHSILVSKLTLRNRSLSLLAGDSFPLSAVITPAAASYPVAVWSSSDPSVAAVGPGGQVTALKPGTAEITVACGTVSDRCTVRVEQALGPFRDVTSDKWYYDDVRYVYEAGVMTGTGETAFSPDAAVTRAMAEQDLYRLAAQEGIEPPAADSGAEPDAPLTRQEFVQMLYRYEMLWRGQTPSGSADLSRFADGAGVDAEAWEAMSWAVGNRLLLGGAENTLDPAAPVSRAQEAAILHRYILLGQSAR